jgi:hypothetical protein
MLSLLIRKAMPLPPSRMLFRMVLPVPPSRMRIAAPAPLTVETMVLLTMRLFLLPPVASI